MVHIIHCILRLSSVFFLLIAFCPLPHAGARSEIGALPPPETVAEVLAAATQVAMGADHACALLADGSVKCWGKNSAKQLGDGTTAERITPVDVVGLGTGITALAAGGGHTCALTSDGGVKCWGANGSGQLGKGSISSYANVGDVIGLTAGVTAIAAGGAHTCAILEDGGLKCWGQNGYGQLGDGTGSYRSTPVDVIGLGSGVRAVAGGDDHTCAVLDNGTMKCWGHNFIGQLGTGMFGGGDSATPVDVNGITNAVAVTAGDFITCALIASGDVLCWGRNTHGQVGDGTTFTRWSPTAVVGLPEGIRQVEAGEYHVCAVTDGRGVICWGRNLLGQLGDGGIEDRHSPTPVTGLNGGVSMISTKGNTACATLQTGKVLCWGDNYYGELGIGVSHWVPAPTEVSGLESGVQHIAAGSSHTCAITAGGGVQCWGSNDDGELGDGTLIQRNSPVMVERLGGAAVELALGPSHTCARLESGSVRCWGDNHSGQLGDGTTSDSSFPVSVSGLPGPVGAISAGLGYTCALVSGSVWCWGDNQFGQLGNGSTTDSLIPVRVNGLNGLASSLAAGGFTTCAITTTGAAKCWGRNSSGNLGDGSTTDRFTPVAVSGLSSGVGQVTIGTSSCALLSGGSVKCWGYNPGDGSGGFRTMPVNVIGMAEGAVQIDAGDSACAITGQGTIRCWGSNNYGEAGDGTTYTRYSPVQVVGIDGGAQGIAAGGGHTCAISAGGGALCWGKTTSGEIGNGFDSYRNTPVEVIGLDGAVQRADLDIGAETVRLAEAPKSGQPRLTRFDIDVYNRGDADAYNVRVLFYKGPPAYTSSFAELLLPVVAANSRETASLDWVVPESPWSGNLFVRLSASTAEHSTANNTTYHGTPVFIAFADYAFNPDSFYFANTFGDIPYNTFRQQFDVYYRDLPPVVGIPPAMLASFAYRHEAQIGHCYGMSSASIAYHQTPALKPLPGVDTFDMEPEGAVLEDIRDHQVRVILQGSKASLVRSEFFTIPLDYVLDWIEPQRTYATLRAALGGETPQPRIFEWINRGHAVVAYKIAEVGDMHAVYIYDPNDPAPRSGELEAANFAVFNPAQNRFKYTVGALTELITESDVLEPLYTPGEVTAAMTADLAETVKKIISRDDQIHVHFGWSDTAGMALAAQAAAGPTTYYFTDSQGRKIGYENGLLVSQIDGAEFHDFGGAYYFTLPAAETYTLTALGSGSQGNLLAIAAPVGAGALQQTVFGDFSLPVGDSASLTFNRSTTDWALHVEGQSDVLPTTDVVENLWSVSTYMPLIIR